MYGEGWVRSRCRRLETTLTKAKGYGENTDRLTKSKAE